MAFLHYSLFFNCPVGDLEFTHHMYTHTLLTPHTICIDIIYSYRINEIRSFKGNIGMNRQNVNVDFHLQSTQVR